MPYYQALNSASTRYKVTVHQQCQQKAAHLVDGVGLCGTHFNAAFRKSLAIVGELRQLGDTDMIGTANVPPG